MNKTYLYIIVFFIISNCTLKDVKRHHGYHYLEKKNNNLFIAITNKNDTLDILGPPSTKGSFDNDLWIYIELLEKKQSLLKLGKNVIDVNNILVLEFNTRGILVEKVFYNKDSMKNIEFSQDKTKNSYQRDNFVYNFLSSLRQKINDPLGKRKTRAKKKK